jgi:hypothetical protein
MATVLPSIGEALGGMEVHFGATTHDTLGIDMVPPHPLHALNGPCDGPRDAAPSAAQSGSGHAPCSNARPAERQRSRPQEDVNVASYLDDCEGRYEWDPVAKETVLVKPEHAIVHIVSAEASSSPETPQ